MHKYKVAKPKSIHKPNRCLTACMRAYAPGMTDESKARGAALCVRAQAMRHGASRFRSRESSGFDRFDQGQAPRKIFDRP